MIDKKGLSELQDIFDSDMSAHWSGWKNIALNLWDALKELDQEADYLARYLSDNDAHKRGPDYWRTRAERVLEHD